MVLCAVEMPKLLLVEDDLALAQTMILSLQRAGMAVEHCSTAEVAIELIQAHRFPVIICDVILGGGMSGLYVVDSLRKIPAEERPEVLVITGASLEYIRGLNRQLVTAILIKPVDFDLFTNMVRVTCEHASRRIPPSTLLSAKKSVHTYCGACDSEIAAWVDAPGVANREEMFEGWMDLPCKTCGTTPRERGGRSELI